MPALPLLQHRPPRGMAAAPRGRRSPPQIPVSMVCNNIETRVCFALRDQGIACLPDFSIREALREGRLVSILDAFCERRARFFLLWPSGRQVSPKLRAFIDFVAPRVIATLG
ncbi:LysR substrate-binding domain-containing protein [Pseudomonas aeruginosa]|nr:LysR substrate-binding domain-containing protein [Pseudomonas aeruginosa]